MGAEFAGLNRLAEFLREAGEEFFVKRNGNLGPGRADVRRAITFLCTREQRELANEEDFSTRFLNRTVHDSVVVVENSQADNFAAQPFDVVSYIGFFNCEENEQTSLDGALDCLADGHFGFGNPLNDGAHGSLDATVNLAAVLG